MDDVRMIGTIFRINITYMSISAYLFYE